MEKQSNNIKEEKFLAHLIKEADLESPSINFTTSVLQKIEAKNAVSSQIQYTPLIPRWAWLLILTIIGVITVILYFGTFVETPISIFFSKINTLRPIDTPLPTVSKIALYAFCFLGLFMLQIPLLKKHFAK